MTDLWPRLKPTSIPGSGSDPGSDPLKLGASKAIVCPVCDDDTCFKTVGSDVSCTRCGTFVDFKLDWGAEYRWFSADGGGTADPSRCGFPVNPLMPESSLGTIISDNNYNPLMTRLRRTHARNIVPGREYTLWKILNTLKVRASNAGISTSVLEEAKELYAQVTATAVCRGEVRRESMIAACLWEALKRHGAPRMPRDIADIFNIPVQWVTRGIKQFQILLSFRTRAGSTDTYSTCKRGTKNMGVGVGVGVGVDAMNAVVGMDAMNADVGIVGMDAVNVDVDGQSNDVFLARAFQRRKLWQKSASHTTYYNDFITPFLTNLTIPQLDSRVRSVCFIADNLGIMPESTPPSFVASIIAFCVGVTEIAVSHTEIARVCGISVVTIQKCLKRLQPWKEKLLAE